jgi:hypothetical protein
MMRRDIGQSIQIGCGVFFLAEIVLFSVIAFLSDDQRDPTWDHARRIEGTIRAIEPASMQPQGYGTKHRIRIDTVQFDYIVGEDAFRFSQDVTNPFFVGQRVDILYLPETPWIAKIPIPDYSPLFPMGLLSCIAIPTFSLLISRWAHRRILRISEKQKRKEKTTA